jgi:Family of unknown function (DUF6152)
MRLLVMFLPCAGVLLWTSTALAHHSVAMFDRQKTVTLSGTVRDFQFNNPHCYIQLLVTADGRTDEWSIELGSPSHLLRSGWKPNTLKVGEKLTIVFNPLHDGGKGGQYMSATDASGKVIGAQP